MIFSVNKYYEVTYKTGEVLTFKVINSTSNFYLIRAKDIEAKEATFLYKLLEKEWVKVEEITDLQ